MEDGTTRTGMVFQGAQVSSGLLSRGGVEMTELAEVGRERERERERGREGGREGERMR